MGVLSIRIPDSLHNELKKVSKLDHISINQFIASAITEKVTAMETENYIQERSKFGNKDKYLSILKKVPNVESLENNE